jgi:uncharacterized protein involved in exopolysaccharide biosynthesis
MSDADQTPNEVPAREAADGELTVLDLLIIVAKRKRVVIGLPLVVGVLTTAVLLLLPNVYTATARIMPPQQGQSAAFAAFGALASIAGGAGSVLGPALGIKNPSDLYVGILKGSTIADRMIARFDLKERFNTDTLVDTRRVLEDITIIQTGRDGLISIDVEDKDPKIAAAMANAYVEELDNFSQKLAVTEASQRRLFYERELVAARTKLATSEVALRVTQEKTGLIQPEGQARAIVEAFAEVSARIAAKEVEVASIQMFATPQNPNYLRAQQELQSLRQQLGKLERAQPREGNGSILMPTSKIPEAAIDYLRSLRELKHHEALYEILVKQHELAKIDEAKDAALVQVVDAATPPDRKSKPKRALILMVVVAITGVLAVLWALAAELLDNVRLNPEGSRRLSELRSLLRR